MVRIALACDHAGFSLKKKLAVFLEQKQYELLDVGTHRTEPSDYPDFVHSACKLVVSKEATFGVVICGTGIGSCIAANKIKGIRSGVCWNEEVARLAREHNDCNVLALPGKHLNYQDSQSIVWTFLNTQFSFEERHVRRIFKLE